MKKLFTTALVLLIALSFSAKKVTLQENKLVATFIGVTDTDYYKFIDDKKIEYLFYDLDENVELGLEDDENIGKKFSITWNSKEIDEIDSQGDETGVKLTVKTILTIVEIK
jgi:hypothetical protein